MTFFLVMSSQAMPLVHLLPLSFRDNKASTGHIQGKTPRSSAGCASILRTEELLAASMAGLKAGAIDGAQDG
jgi:hypothetical protein